MSGNDLAAAVVTVLSLVASGALVGALVLVVAALRRLRATLAALHQETLPMVEELRRTVTAATGEVERVSELVGSVEAISARVDGASRLAAAALSKPVIKTVAAASGTGRAARRLRGGS